MNWRLPCVLVILAIALLMNPVLAADPDVKAAQKTLSGMGYEPGPADGLMGPSTRAAIESFQRHKGLPVTGKADDATLEALGIEPAFIIPLPFEISGDSNGLRAEVLYLKGKPEVVLFSFECEGCEAKVPMMGMGHFDLSKEAWSNGAEHLHRGRSTDKAETSLHSQQATVGAGGQILMVVKEGQVFGSNRLMGWHFESSEPEPLVFRVVRGKGYVHMEGSGRVRDPAGQQYTFE